ncbi:MAG: hypothetical protein M3010_01235, partial [Candidatus Dormibacteraeota bacterium]|nr:hypothetical protein [Candidatus Dormibacteraeota bacterium]
LAAVILTGGAFTTFAAPALHRAETAAAKPKAAPSGEGAKAQQYCDSFLKDFAGKLGVKTDAVLPALKASLKDSIGQAVTNGDLTAAQATKIKAHIDAVQGCADLGKLAGIPGLHGKRSAGTAAVRPEVMQTVIGAAATALKTTPAELQKAVMAGDPLSKVAERAGVSKAAFDPAFKTALKTQLDADVAAGKLTATQETELIDHAVKIADTLWDKPLTGPHGGLFGHGGPPAGPPDTHPTQ